MMRNTIIYKHTAFVLAMLLLPLALCSQSYTESRQIVKMYKVNTSTTIDVSNKYGKIHVVPWSADSVKFVIDLSIRSKNAARLNKIKNSIDFDFTGTEYYVVVSTVFGANYGTVISDLQNIAGSIISSENQVVINYMVYVPQWANLKIENKFGNVFIDDMEGDLNLNISNGDLKVNKLVGQNNISISSGGAVINYIEKGKINIAYSDILIKEAGNITFDSRSSKIDVDKVDMIRTNSRRDKYSIGEINKMFGNTYFSDIYIAKFTKEMSFDANYGNISLNSVSNTFSLININSEYTDLDLRFEQGTGYSFDMKHNNDVIFSFPQEKAKLEEKVMDEEEEKYLIYGYIGPENKKSKVNITALRKCYVNIYHK